MAGETSLERGDTAMLKMDDRTRRGFREAVLLPLAFNGLAGICLFLAHALVL